MSNNKNSPSWAYEKIYWESDFCNIAGVDEVGRGPLAGPVVAAAVIIPFNSLDSDNWINGLRDSKLLTEHKREQLAHIISQSCSYGLGIVSAQIIDQINIRNATLLAMKNAVTALDIQADALLIDGRDGIESKLPQKKIIKGDNNSYSIAAASILAKVTRDRMMKKLDILFPGYELAKNNGYPTAQHRTALYELGYTNIHRLSFAPVRNVLLKRLSSR
tara:strand:+ start:306 stop:959 length:654 start_codon:yes stop_codon:yes gene_type:complete